MIDVSKNIIVDVEATPSTIALEVRATKPMLDRIADPPVTSQHGT